MPDAKPGRPIKGRHQARKRAVDLLFEAEARGVTPAEAANARTALAAAKPDVAPLNPYTATVARGVSAHAAHLDDLIASYLQGWTLERLPAVDRAILRVAVWELLHADDVPAPVAVDEAVELAKELSTDDSRASSTGCWARSCWLRRRSGRPLRPSRGRCGTPARIHDPAGAARRHRCRVGGDGRAGGGECARPTDRR